MSGICRRRQKLSTILHEALGRPLLLHTVDMCTGQNEQELLGTIGALLGIPRVSGSTMARHGRRMGGGQGNQSFCISFRYRVGELVKPLLSDLSCQCLLQFFIRSGQFDLDVPAGRVVSQCCFYFWFVDCLRYPKGSSSSLS